YLAARLATEDPAVRALILLATTVRPLDRALIVAAEREAAALAEIPPSLRLAQGIPPDFDPVRVMVNTIEALSLTNAPVLEVGGHRIKADWFRQHVRADPIATFRRVRCPALILHGTEDRLVDPAEADAIAHAMWAGGNPSVAVIRLSGLDHYFEPAGGAAALDAQLFGALEGWLGTEV
ncbi:MAG TPA: alpha/beta hydrolase, partial [Dehalococcoidia bacterium]|nr:alpha/beta hydrolase [Dehalococcoidia bacterium]